MAETCGLLSVMQLFPATAADKCVGVTDIVSRRPHVYAGAKHMRYLITTYITDPGIGERKAVHYVGNTRKCHVAYTLATVLAGRRTGGLGEGERILIPAFGNLNKPFDPKHNLCGRALRMLNAQRA